MKNKSFLVLVFFLLFVKLTKAQDFNSFYEHVHGIFTPWSTIICNSSYVEATVPSNGMTMWGLLSYEGIIAKDNMWGLSFWVKTRQLGDMVATLRSLISERKDRIFSKDAYFSDFGFLPNIRFGLNVFATDNIIVNAGIFHNYYIYQLLTPSNGRIQDDLLCFGPHVYVDRILTDWLALRVGVSPQFNYANGNKNMGFKYNAWELNTELFTTSGFYFGVDLAHLGGIHHEVDSKISFKRIDYKLGYKFKN